jgi:hypothetical protein
MPRWAFVVLAALIVAGPIVGAFVASSAFHDPSRSQTGFSYSGQTSTVDSAILVKDSLQGSQRTVTISGDPSSSTMTTTDYLTATVNANGSVSLSNPESNASTDGVSTITVMASSTANQTIFITFTENGTIINSQTSIPNQTVTSTVTSNSSTTVTTTESTTIDQTETSFVATASTATVTITATNTVTASNSATTLTVTAGDVTTATLTATTASTITETITLTDVSTATSVIITTVTIP